MRILAINGSHRGERGYTQFLINKLLSGSTREGAECETISLSNYKITPCTGCRVCNTRDHYLRCIFEDKDDVKMIFDKMRQADILIFASPVYIFTLSGLMKILLDRTASTADSSIMALSNSGLFFHHIDKSLVSKPLVLLTTQDNLEDETSINIESYFNTFVRFSDAENAGVIRCKSGGVVGYGLDHNLQKQYPKIQLVYQAIEQAGSELVQFGKIKRKTMKIASQNVINIPKIIEFLLKSKVVRNNHTIMSKIFEKAMQFKKNSK